MFSIFKKKTPKEYPAEVEPELSSDQQLIQSVKNFRNEIQDVAEKVEFGQDRSMADAKKRIEYAEKFVDETGIGQSITFMLDQMWHWVSWFENDDFDFEDHEKIGISELCGDDSAEKYVLINFVYCGEKYRLEFDTYPNKGLYGKIELFHNGNLVFAVDVEQSSTTVEYSSWHYVYTTVLETGIWVGHVVEIEEKIRLLNEENYKADEVNWTLDQAKDLPEAD